MFDKGTSGASCTYPAQASALRKNGHVMIKQKPCKIVELTTASPGKHGHAKVRMYVHLDLVMIILSYYETMLQDYPDIACFLC